MSGSKICEQEETAPGILKLSKEESDDEDEDFFDEKIKKKFLSAWNNVKYGKVNTFFFF